MPLYTSEAPLSAQTQTERVEATLKVFGKDSRYKRLEHFWLRYLGLHYDCDVAELGALKEWEEDTDSDGSAVPLQKRKPLLRVNFGAALINRASDLLDGEGQTPTIRFVNGDGKTLGEATDAWKRIAERLDFAGLWSEATPQILATGSGALAAYIPIVGAKRVSCVSYPAYQVMPILVGDLYGSTGRSLGISTKDLGYLRQTAEEKALEDDEIVYLDVKAVWTDEDPDGNGLKRSWLARKVFWPDRVVTFKDLDITNWSLGVDLPQNIDRVVKHDLGFVPAVWVRTQRTKDEVDGVPLLEGVETLCDAVDRMQSQLFRGATYHGDGTLAPKDETYAQILNALGDQEKLLVGAKRVLPCPMEVVEIDGEGQRVQAELIRALKEEIQDRVGIRLPDPSKITGQLAASALEQLDQTTVAKVTKLRLAWGRGRTRLARYAMMLAVRAKMEAPSDLPADGSWRVVADWPPVYAPNAQDRLLSANASAAAEGIITRKARTAYVARSWGIADPDAEAKAALAEYEEAQKKMFDQVAAAARAPGAGVPVNPGQRAPGASTPLRPGQRDGQTGAGGK